MFTIDQIYDFAIKIKPMFFFYFGWMCLNFTSVQFYNYYCVPNSVSGFLLQPFFYATPHCSAFRWIIYESSNVFYTMWIAIGTWCMGNIIPNK